CRPSTARRSCCASWKGCRIRRSRPSPAPPSAPSCPAWPAAGTDCKRAWPTAWPRSRNVSCEEIRDLLSPYSDDELDLVRGVEIERHLEGCPACAAALEQTRSLSVPADIQGGDAVAAGTPSRRNDALSVRSFTGDP